MIEQVRTRSRLVMLAALVALVLLGASVASAAPQRLSKTQWATYLKAYNPYLAQTTKTVARFRKCRSSTAYTKYLEAFNACLGTTPAKEVAATNALFATLSGFQKKVGGACAKSQTSYTSAVYFWKSIVIGINRALRIKSSNVATIAGQAQNGVLAAQRVAADAKAFAGACKPAS
jgi:hypothetical protein